MKLQKFALLAALVALPSMLFAQTASVYHFNAALSPSNENPALDAVAVGDAHILIKGYRNSNGDLIQANVDFNVEYYTGQPELLVAMHIHSGAAGVNGGVVISSGLAGPVEADGEGHIFTQAKVTEADGLATVEAILANPAGYYVNIHSMTAPPGLMRGQLQRTTLSMIQMTKAQTASIEAKIDAMSATLERIANRLGVVPVDVE